MVAPAYYCSCFHRLQCFYLKATVFPSTNHCTVVAFTEYSICTWQPLCILPQTTAPWFLPQTTVLAPWSYYSCFHKPLHCGCSCKLHTAFAPCGALHLLPQITALWCFPQSRVVAPLGHCGGFHKPLHCGCFHILHCVNLWFIVVVSKNLCTVVASYSVSTYFFPYISIA